jgi:uncharacterized protein (TIGR03663 family)
MKLSKRTFIFCFILIGILACFLRLYNLDLKPMHSDEGVLENFFVQPLLNNKIPSFLGIEYHGLAFHYLSYPFVKFLGNSLFSLRFSSALFGILSVLSLYFLKDKIGRFGTLISALVLAISPIFVYYSRQYTGYPFYVFFIFVFIILLFQMKKEKLRIYSLALVSAILININEAFLVFLFILVFFIYLENLGKEKKIVFKKEYLFAFLLFLLICLIIHTGFFMKLENLSNLFQTSSDLGTKMTSTGHNKSFLYYLFLLIPFETPLIILSALGLFFYRKDRFSYFVIFFSLVSSLIFSLISYKTNWTILAIFFPLIFLSGIGAENFLEKIKSKKKKILFFITLTLILLINLILCIHQNFIFVNDFTINKIGYVETSTEINQLVKDINNYSSQKEDIKILIGLDSYWPLPSLLKKDYSLHYLKMNASNMLNYPEYQVFILKESSLTDFPSNFEIKEYEMRNNYKINVAYLKE